MKKTYLIIIYIFTPILFLNAQSPYTNVQIRGSSSYGEVSIEINTKNINQLVGGVNINGVFYSNDGGMTWTNGSLSNSLWGVWGDPVLVSDTLGHFYYFHLSNTPSSNGGYWIDRIVCQKSTNAGVNWSNPGSYTYFNPPRAQQDKEWGAVDFTHGSRGNWLYCTWTQFDRYNSSLSTDSSNILFARSTDAGSNWTSVARINKLAGNCLDNDYTVEGAVPCVGPNGEVYVAWAGPQGPGDFKIFFDRSTDGGNTWLANDIVVANQIGGWVIDISGINRSNGMPVTLCDYSNSPYRGHIYVMWIDSVSPGDHDIKFSKSTNGGFNWSTPMKVNSDTPGKEQFLFWMTVDQVTGHIYVVFYDRRNYSDNQTDVFIARSTNGGTSFTNERISSSPFTPTSGPFFGDYIDIAAHNGRVRPVWQRLQSGVISIWTAIIEFPVGVTHNNNQIPSAYILEQNYPNPFNPETNFSFALPVRDYVVIKIFDVLGNEVATLTNEMYEAGSYSIKWDASEISSGVYFYRMNTLYGNYSETKKMVLTK